MKIKTKLTVILFVSYVMVIIVFVGVIGSLFSKNQEENLAIFKNELLQENTKLIEGSAELFFNLMDLKFVEGASSEEVFEYIKDIDQLNRSVVVHDYEGRSILKNHSRKEFETFISKEVIDRQLELLETKNKKNFSLDNYDRFLESTDIIAPKKVYYQIYNSAKLVIGYGQSMDDMTTRLTFLERKNEKNKTNLLLITFLIIILGVLFIIAAALYYSGKSIFAPLGLLTDSFGRVARGELLHRMDVPANDEIGKLSRSFNDMTENLNQLVSEIKAANIKLDSYSRELEQRVESRTRELSGAVERLKREIEERKQVENELRKAQVEAESANRAKTHFLANMSHEIRTPMNAIIGMAELAMETELTVEQEEYITILKSSAESLLGLLNDILDLSKIEVRKLDIEPIEFHFRNCLGEIGKNFFIQTQRKEIELIYDIAPEIPAVLVGDPGRLRQILTNLLGNAVKFTEKGLIVVRVNISDRTSPTKEKAAEIVLHFTISDTGVGIPEDKQELIFEKFTQTDGSITRRFGGSGLGLAISLQLVQLMKGKIWVESPGELKHLKPDAPGSTFHFILPFLFREERLDIGEAIDIKELKGVSVLVVDDNPINRKVFKAMSERWGMKPRLAENGMEALEVLKQNRAAGENKKEKIQLVLMDIQMPVMDGFEVVKRMREEKLAGGMQVIVLTSAGSKGDGKRCRDLGIAAYLRKPVPSSELLEAILIVMGNVSRKKKDSKLITRYSLRENRKQLNLLVAEDNLVNQKLIKRILEKRGYLVNIANDGKETVEKLEEGNYDLVLMDIQMPVMDGIEATRLIRQKEKEADAPRVPIIALTAHAMKGDEERFLEAGMNAYISKPIRQAELMEVLETFLYGAKG